MERIDSVHVAEKVLDRDGARGLQLDPKGEFKGWLTGAVCHQP
jgi:hypothetical protein